MGSGTAGITVTPGNTDTQILNNNVFSSFQGIQVDVNSDRTIVQGNIVNGMVTFGIEVFGSKNVQVLANKVTNNGALGETTGAGIFLVGNIEGTAVINNVVVGNDPVNIATNASVGAVLAGNIVTED